MVQVVTAKLWVGPFSATVAFSLVLSLHRGYLEGTQCSVLVDYLCGHGVKCQHPEFGFYGMQITFILSRSRETIRQTVIIQKRLRVCFL